MIASGKYYGSPPFNAITPTVTPRDVTGMSTILSDLQPKPKGSRRLAVRAVARLSNPPGAHQGETRSSEPSQTEDR